MNLSITDVKQLLGQGLRTDSACAVNPESVDSVVREETGIAPCPTIGQEAAARIADSLDELLTVASSQDMERRVVAIIDGVVTERAQGSGDCAPSTSVDEPKEKNDSYFSTHLKRTGDFIEPADY